MGGVKGDETKQQQQLGNEEKEKGEKEKTGQLTYVDFVNKLKNPTASSLLANIRR